MPFPSTWIVIWKFIVLFAKWCFFLIVPHPPTPSHSGFLKAPKEPFFCAFKLNGNRGLSDQSWSPIEIWLQFPERENHSEASPALAITRFSKNALNRQKTGVVYTSFVLLFFPFPLEGLRSRVWRCDCRLWNVLSNVEWLNVVIKI